MNERIATDSELQALLKGGTYFRAYCKICRKKAPLLYHNWREDVKTEIIRVVNGDTRVLDELKKMLECSCEKDELDTSSSGLLDYGAKLVTVFIPVMVVITQLFYGFSSDVATIQNSVIGSAIESMQMLKESFQISILEAGIVLTISLLLLWGLNGIQKFLDYNMIMHILYNKELLKIVNSIL